MSKKWLPYALTLLIGGLLLGLEAPSYAADAADVQVAPNLEEIVVTAQKRSESVQNVPVSITVLSAAELDRVGVQTIDDLSKMSASLEFTTPGASPGGGAFIRGIGTESVGGDTATPSVSIVLDGVVLGNTNVSDLFDVNRVEILKGPQGTLFGSSVSAGVISITTNVPDPSAMSSTIAAEFGSGNLGSQYSREVLRGTVNLPLATNSAIRFSAHVDNNSGVFTNPFEGISSDGIDAGARVRYLLNVSDDFHVNLIADYNNTTTNGYSQLTYRYAPPGSALAISLAQCGVAPSTENYQFCSDNTNRGLQLDRGVSAQLDWGLGGNTLTSISSYRLGSTEGRNDIQSIPLSISEVNFAFPQHCQFFNCVPIFQIQPGGPNDLQTQYRYLITQELRLASPQNHQFEWLAGIYYQHYKLNDSEPGLLTANFGGGQFTENTFFSANATTQDYAAFGNATYYLADNTRLIAGARFTHSEVTENKYDPPNTGTQQTYSLTTSASKPTFRLGIQHNFDPQTMAYATLSTGYKAPEISDNLSNGQRLYAVSPELPQAAEIGIKTSVFDNRLAIDADVFYEKVKGYQGQACSPNAQGTITCAPVNVSKVDTKGIELDIFGRPLPGLTLDLTGILNPATYPAGYLGSDGSNLGGQQLNYASKTKVTFSGEQVLPLTAVYSAVIGADVVYRSAQSQYTSALSEFIVPATTIENARIGIRSSNNWGVYLFGRNVGAKVYPQQLYPTPFQTGGLWQALDANGLRIVGLQLQAKF